MKKLICCLTVLVVTIACLHAESGRKVARTSIELQTHDETHLSPLALEKTTSKIRDDIVGSLSNECEYAIARITDYEGNSFVEFTNQIHKVCEQERNNVLLSLKEKADFHSTVFSWLSTSIAVLAVLVALAGIASPVSSFVSNRKQRMEIGAQKIEIEEQKQTMDLQLSRMDMSLCLMRAEESFNHYWIINAYACSRQWSSDEKSPNLQDSDKFRTALRCISKVLNDAIQRKDCQYFDLAIQAMLLIICKLGTEKQLQEESMKALEKFEWRICFDEKFKKFLQHSEKTLNENMDVDCQFKSIEKFYNDSVKSGAIPFKG